MTRRKLKLYLPLFPLVLGCLLCHSAFLMDSEQNYLVAGIDEVKSKPLVKEEFGNALVCPYNPLHYSFGILDESGPLQRDARCPVPDAVAPESSVSQESQPAASYAERAEVTELNSTLESSSPAPEPVHATTTDSPMVSPHFPIPSPDIPSKPSSGEQDSEDHAEKPPVEAGGAAAKKNKTDHDIPSFSEWTQKALEEEQKKREEGKRKKVEDHGHSNQTSDREAGQISPSRLKKNFASVDCGAKVVAANQESQGLGNIISYSKDEYMLNKCSDKAWFVVELCETIKAHRLEIANFELYSSVPKEIRVSMTNKYPARDKDWVAFGTFEAEDMRSLQSFSSEEGIFGKYVMVELLSHYGSEHYCPISLFKMYGISEIELMGEEEEDDDEDGHAHFTQEEPELDPPPRDATNVVQFLKDKMDETIERVVGVFRPRDQVDIGLQAGIDARDLNGISLAHEVWCPGCDQDKVLDVRLFLTADWVDMKRMLAQNPFLRRSLFSRICDSYGFHMLPSQNAVDACGSYQLVEFFKTLFGTSRLIALCNVIAVQENRIAGKGRQAEEGSRPASDGGTVDNSTNGAGAGADKSNGSFATAQNDVRGRSSTTAYTISSTTMTPVDDSAPLKSESIVVESTIGSTSDEDLKRISPSPVSPANTGPSTTERGTSTRRPEATAGTESSMRELPNVLHVPPVDANPDPSVDNSQAAAPELPKGNGAGAQRDSVWLKLSNRIKTLERNVSLSGGYLEELSVRYKKQIEDLQLSVRQSDEDLAAANDARQRDKALVLELKSHLGSLVSTVERLEDQAQSTKHWMLYTHVVFLAAELVVALIMLFTFCLRPRMGGIPLPPIQREGEETRERKAILKASNGSEVEEIQIQVAAEEDDENEGDEEPGPVLNSSSPKPLVNGVRSNPVPKLEVCDPSPLARKNRRRRQTKNGLCQRSAGFANGVGEESCRQVEHLSARVYKTIHVSPSRRDSSQGWKRVARSGSTGRIDYATLSDSECSPGRFTVRPVVVNGFADHDRPPLHVSNKFELLDNSVHDEQTPAKGTAAKPSNVGSLKPKKLFGGGVNGVNGDARHRHHSRGGGKPLKPKRSKSTSPTRIGPAAKQKDLYKNFNPETAEWMQNH